MDRCDCYNVERNYPIINTVETLENYMRYQRNANNLYLPFELVFEVTQRCTLKCKYCAALMQYFTSPKNYDINQVCADIKRIFEFIDFVDRVTIIGGEPFLVKELDKVFNALAEYRSKMERLVVTTNGTLVPSNPVIESIRNVDGVVLFSDYGELAKKKQDFIVKLNKLGAKYEERIDQKWTNCKLLLENINNADVAKQILCKCTSSCLHVANGRLFPCSFISGGYALKAFPIDESNSVDIYDNHLSKSRLEAFVYDTTLYEGCRYCSGNGKVFVPVAEQIREPLPYRSYE
jgi:MoaA/NifB/PqqE/SkfB family radical SAM enzyme